MHLGVGVNSYLTFLRQLMLMMGIISLTVLPVIYILTLFDLRTIGIEIQSYDLGDIGGAEALCRH